MKKRNYIFDGAERALTAALKQNKTEFDVSYLIKYEPTEETARAIAKKAIYHLQRVFPGIRLELKPLEEQSVSPATYSLATIQIVNDITKCKLAKTLKYYVSRRQTILTLEELQKIKAAPMKKQYIESFVRWAMRLLNKLNEKLHWNIAFTYSNQHNEFQLDYITE